MAQSDHVMGLGVDLAVAILSHVSRGQASLAAVDDVKVAILPVSPPMTLDAVTNAVHRLEHRLRTEFGVVALYVFGSVARGEARADSDIDVLVEFDGPATFARFMDLKALLEDTLGAQVDLVTRAALRSQLKHRIEVEARRVA